MFFSASPGDRDALLLPSGQDAASRDHNHGSDVKGHCGLCCGNWLEAGQSHHRCWGEPKAIHTLGPSCIEVDALSCFELFVPFGFKTYILSLVFFFSAPWDFSSFSVKCPYGFSAGWTWFLHDKVPWARPDWSSESSSGKQRLHPGVIHLHSMFTLY